MIRERLKRATDRQKSYADIRRKDSRYEIGEKVFLKVSPWKKVMRFGKKGKLSPRFIGPYVTPPTQHMVSSEGVFFFFLINL